jgi:membrane protease YdiL (CAAX protease family)
MTEMDLSRVPDELGAVAPRPNDVPGIRYDAFGTPIPPPPRWQHTPVATSSVPAPTPGIPTASISSFPPAPRVQWKPLTLPVEPKQYHEFYRTPAYQAWKPWVLLITVALGFIVANVVFAFIMVLMSMDDLGGLMTSLTGGYMSWDLLLLVDLSIAAAIPICIGLHRAWMGQKPGWLASIQGRFRWKVCLKALLVVLPLFIVMAVADYWVTGMPELQFSEQTIPMLLVVIFATPFQCAGEEYLCRGIAFRSIGSAFPNRTAGLIVGGLASALIFTALHGSLDPWLILVYFTVGVGACVLVWRTGGLEAAIALHAANNWVSEALMPFTPDVDMFDREVGVGSPWVLIQVAAIVLAVLGILWQARKLPTAAALASNVTAAGALGQFSEAK